MYDVEHGHDGAGSEDSHEGGLGGHLAGAMEAKALLTRSRSTR